MKRKVIALTGTIGSGKSEVARILRTWGYETVDCDLLARQFADSSEVVSQVEQLLGSDCVVDGKLNRATIRGKVFKDEDLLKRYGQIFFDGVRRLLTEAVQATHGNVVFVEIPILDAFQFDFAEVWRIESDRATQVNRVTARDKVPAENVFNILDRQKKYDDVTRVIVNNGSLDELTDTVKKTLADCNLSTWGRKN